MVRLCWLTSADKTGLASHKSKVLFRAVALGFANSKGTLINFLTSTKRLARNLTFDLELLRNTL